MLSLKGPKKFLNLIGKKGTLFLICGFQKARNSPLVKGEAFAPPLKLSSVYRALLFLQAQS